jgi:hypothetical protein
MQLTITTLIACLAVVSLAAPPLPVCRIHGRQLYPDVSDEPSWTLESVRRLCDMADMNCAWSFTINNHVAYQAPTPCKYNVSSFNGIPASMSSLEGVTCGPYHVTSAWSGQFGPDKGFTTLAIVEVEARLVVYPAYSDEQLRGGAVVVPDMEFVPHAF